MGFGWNFVIFNRQTRIFLLFKQIFQVFTPKNQFLLLLSNTTKNKKRREIIFWTRNDFVIRFFVFLFSDSINKFLFLLLLNFHLPFAPKVSGGIKPDVRSWLNASAFAARVFDSNEAKMNSAFVKFFSREGKISFFCIARSGFCTGASFQVWSVVYLGDCCVLRTYSCNFPFQAAEYSASERTTKKNKKYCPEKKMGEYGSVDTSVACN